MSRRRADTPPLTKRRIDQLVYPHPKGSTKSYYVPDGGVCRLYVRVYRSGRKAFVIRATVGGKKRESKIGEYGPLTIDDARRLAVAKLMELDEGIEITRRVNEVSNAPTFAEFLERFFEQHGDALRSGAELRRLAKRRLLGRFGETPLDEIALEDVLKMRTELVDKPYEANRAMDLLKTVLNKAVRWEVLPEAYRNPVNKVDRYPERPRERVLTSDEVDRLLSAFDQIDSVHTRVLFRTLINMPLRKSELMRARWDGFDVSTGTLRISANSSIKGVAPQPILPELALEIDALPRFENNPFIFPSRDRKSHIRDIDSQWKRVKELAGVTNARLHDLRRTIATEYARLGASSFQIQSALGQKTDIASKHYVRLASAETARELMELRRAARSVDAVKSASHRTPPVPARAIVCRRTS